MYLIIVIVMVNASSSPLIIYVACLLTCSDSIKIQQIVGRHNVKAAQKNAYGKALKLF